MDGGSSEVKNQWDPWTADIPDSFVNAYRERLKLVLEEWTKTANECVKSWAEYFGGEDKVPRTMFYFTTRFAGARKDTSMETDKEKISYEKALALANKHYINLKIEGGMDLSHIAPEQAPEIQSDQVKAAIKAIVEIMSRG